MVDFISDDDACNRFQGCRQFGGPSREIGRFEKVKTINVVDRT